MAKKQTALAVVAEPEAPRETLHLIETELRELIEFRDGLPENEAEAIKACDEQIQQYVGREIRKVTAIAAILRWFKSQAAAAAAEEEHAAKWRKRWEARYNRLATMVHSVMVMLDVPKLEGATDRFRRQQNPEATEVYDMAAVPDVYLKATVRLSMYTWKALVKEHKLEPDPAFITVTSEVDAVKLKAALQSSVDCSMCKGVGELAIDQGKDTAACPGCAGLGQVRATIPGARLTRGEHMRVE